MISKSITLLPLSKMRKTEMPISVEFSQKIFDKVPSFNNVRVVLPLSFEKKATDKNNVHITNNVNSVYTSNNKQFTTKEIKMNSFVVNNLKSVFNNNDNRVFKKDIALSSKSNESKTTLNYVDMRNHNDFTQNNHFVKSSMDYVYKPQSETFNLIQNSNTSIKKVVENFVYKSENRVESRLQDIENKITYITKNEINNKEINLSQTLSKEERQIKNNELHNMSEKVYTIVMKKLNRERVRKGDLYV